MLLVRLEMFHPALIDQLDYPARVEVDAEADATAMLTEMLDGQAEAPWSGRPEHQPVRTLGKVLLWESLAEQLVIGAKVVGRHTTLRHAGSPARFEHVDRLVSVRLWHPAPHGPAAQPIVLAQAELAQVLESADIFSWVKAQLGSKLQPKRRSGVGIEVPAHDVAHMCVELFTGRLNLSIIDGSRLLSHCLQLQGGSRLAGPSRHIALESGISKITKI